MLSKLRRYITNYWYLWFSAILIFVCGKSLILSIAHSPVQIIQNNPVGAVTSIHNNEWESFIATRTKQLGDTSTVLQGKIFSLPVARPRYIDPVASEQAAALLQQAEAERSHYKLKGISGKSTALLTNLSGQTQMVQIGDRIDSATLIEISNESILLKDRAGVFSVTIQP